MPGLARVGRNEPCPCGSGRKYKGCCLPRDEAFETARDGLAALSDILLRCVRMPEVFPAVERLWDRYWPEDPPKALSTVLDTDDGSERDLARTDLPAFLVWLVHGAPLEDLPPNLVADTARRSAGSAPTLLDVAVGDHEEPPSTPAGALIESLRSSVGSAFQVIRREPGRRVWLRDVFTDETFEVGDRNLSEDAVTGEVLIGRIRPVEGIHEAVGSAWRFPATAVRDLRPWGELHLSRFREFQPDASWRDLWRERWELLHHYVVERRQRPLQPHLFTTTGEQVVLCRIEWRVRDREALAGALDTHGPELRHEDDAPEWVWVPAPGDPRWVRRTPSAGPEAPVLPGGPALGRIVLHEDSGRLVLETMSAERAEAGRALLESIAGGHLSLVSEHRRSVADMVAEERAAGGAEGPGPDIPDAALRQATEEYIADYERRWVDMSIPALGGKTPRQAAASAEPLLRRQLQDLLLEIEEAEARTRAVSRRGGVGMSVDRLRHLLGVEDSGSR